ncbi:hypothetical protein L2719_11200 [Shewanella schlegeliana]|uniref:Uncharacterized protein n=1 Tax=Shewanella schlegeliana TaxID=190308 RepID=A0ABS1STU4_9GAMM|nr:hypothetical protein [Shewanella schlegeliana]MBL4911933.1 hypothetical protein [Shewanella schlegeliana]MCL1110114.1 hypothetical protein [Shewanella schlegeliana]GIU26810.1 hypothetical protein TUM4433_13080 [Shewanella schlegeliana]
MQINTNQVVANKLDSNKATASVQAQTVVRDSVESVLPAKAEQALVLNDYHEDAAALKSRLGAHIEYENQTGGQRGAVAEYLINQHAAKRDEIQQMVGIDTYA